MSRVLDAWRNHRWLVVGFLIALSATLFFGTRMVLFTIYWSDPAHRDQALKGWMTPGYVANSWDIPRDDLLAELGDLIQSSARKTLTQIARDNDVPLTELIARIEAAIAAQRLGR